MSLSRTSTSGKPAGPAFSLRAHCPICFPSLQSDAVAGDNMKITTDAKAVNSQNTPAMPALTGSDH